MNIVLDGREVRAETGETLLEVAEREGIDLPTLCHHPALAPEGSCRLCLVEEARTGKLVPACATPAVDGARFETASPRVLETRRSTLQLILAHHPLNCDSCSQTGACELETLAARLNIPRGELAGAPRGGAPDVSHPFVAFDPARCILCHRCMRGCAEIQGRNAIGLFARGADSFIGTGIDQQWADSTCESCGTCVGLCPTGALYDKPASKRAIATERITTTICPYCGVGCTIDLHVSQGRVQKVTPNWSRGVNRGALCVKGRFGHEFIHHPDRLTRPLLRDRATGEFHEVTWDEALDWFASRLAEVKQRAGPDALAVVSSAKATNEENYLVQKFARAVIGTNNVDHCARL